MCYACSHYLAKSTEKLKKNSSSIWVLLSSEAKNPLTSLNDEDVLTYVVNTVYVRVRNSLTVSHVSVKINLMGKELLGSDMIQFSYHGWIATMDWLQLQEFGKNQWKHFERMSSYVECTVKSIVYFIITCKSCTRHPLYE